MEIELDDRWSIGGKPHGGYLLRHLTVPALDDTHPHPLAVSAHYLRSPDPGRATVEVETLRNGRRVSQHRARLLQDGQTCVEALVTSGTLHDSEPFWSSAPVPDMPTLDKSVRSPADINPDFRVGHLDFVDSRLDLSTAGFATGEQTPPGVVRAHVRMDEPTGVVDLLVLADALPPVTMTMRVPGWVPTVELTVLIRALPADGWLVAEQSAELMQDGWLDETCRLWDSRGRLVCQARQLAGYRAPS